MGRDLRELKPPGRWVGRRLEVLLERPGRQPEQLAGRSPYMQAVHLEAPARLLGRLMDTYVDKAHPNSLSGRIEAPAADAESAPRARGAPDERVWVGAEGVA